MISQKREAQFADGLQPRMLTVRRLLRSANRVGTAYRFVFAR